jgi:hypothetical protein
MIGWLQYFLFVPRKFLFKIKFIYLIKHHTIKKRGRVEVELQSGHLYTSAALSWEVAYGYH